MIFTSISSLLKGLPLGRYLSYRPRQCQYPRFKARHRSGLTDRKGRTPRPKTGRLANAKLRCGKTIVGIKFRASPGRLRHEVGASFMGTVKQSVAPGSHPDGRGTSP